MDETGYVFVVTGRNQNSDRSSYGLCFATNELEAKGWAISYFEEHHPGCSIGGVGVTQVVLKTYTVAVENNLLVKKELTDEPTQKELE